MPALLRFFALRIKRLEPFRGRILALEPRLKDVARIQPAALAAGWFGEDVV